MPDDDTTTPAAAGYSMPAEWDRHAACLMAWPSRPDLWGDRLDDAKRDYAAVAGAIADFEPVLMVCVPAAGHGPVLEFLATAYQGRAIVGVPAATLAFGGGGPHCITQQIPAGAVTPPITAGATP